MSPSKTTVAIARSPSRLDPARYTTQIRQLEDLGILAKDKITAAKAMTTEFLP